MRDDELDDEIRADLEMEIEERIARGMTRKEAELSAYRDFGNVTLVKEVTREMRGWRWLDRLGQDVRYGLRLVRRSPGFAGAVILSIALGTGAVTAVFSVVNGVLLRPLAFPDAGRLVMVVEHPSGTKGEPALASEPDFEDFQRQSTSFELLAPFIPSFTFPMTDTDNPILVRCTGVGAGFFDVLGMKPILGRPYSPDVYLHDGPEVILSYGFWQRRFGGDPNVIGQPIHLNHSTDHIIAVMPPTTDLFTTTDIWASYGPVYEWAKQRGNRFLSIVGRLKPGITAVQAQQELQAIYHRMPGAPAAAVVEVLSLKEQITGGIRPALLVLLAAVALLLLIASANVANLLLCRATARRAEIATRFALGASRGRLARQFLTESLVLALIGGGCGLLLAKSLVRLLLSLDPGYMPRANGIHIDLPVLLFTLAVSLAAGLAAGVMPVLAASGETLYEQVKSSRTSAAPRQWARGALVSAELAIAVILLVGAGLLGRSFWRLLNVRTGFEAEHVLTMRLRVSDIETKSSFYPDLLSRLGARPSVVAAAVSDCLPAGYLPTADLIAPERPPEPGRVPVSDACFVSGAYFRALGIPLLAGRAFDEREGPNSPAVTVVSESVARRLWPGENPLGKTLRVNYRSLGRPLEDSPVLRQVIGVVGDVRQRGLETPSNMAVYLPYRQDSTLRSLRAMVLFARTAGDPNGMARSIQADVRALSRDVPVQSVRSLQAIVQDTEAPRVFTLVLLGTFAAIAVLLAAIGLYGVIAYSVSRRVREIGIRMALGANKADILTSVFRREGRWLCAGVAAGVLGAAFLSRLMAGMLFGVAPWDPVTFAGVLGVLALIAVAACWAPARRAVRLDPVLALRNE